MGAKTVSCLAMLASCLSYSVFGEAEPCHINSSTVRLAGWQDEDLSG